MTDEERRDSYIKALLTALADGYRTSKKDSGTNRIHRRTQIKPEKLYRSYRRNDAELAELQALNEAAEYCRSLGFVHLEQPAFSSELTAIVLSDEKIEAVEAYLKEKFGYETKRDKLAYVETMLVRYEGRSPAADQLCGRLRAALKEKRVPKGYLQTEELLRALVFIENNQEPLFLREASMLIYGSSKYLEEMTLDGVCRELRAFLRKLCGEDEMQDEILEEYQIFREAQRLCIKGDVTIEKCGTELSVAAFPGGIEFQAEDLAEIERIHVRAKRLITVENRTSYLRCSDKEKAFFYLGGYTTRAQRDFLKRLAEDNPGLPLLHFGDIDAGGFYIHEHLCRITGLPFSLWHMSSAELADPKMRRFLLKLTENDRTRLNKLKEHALYRDTVSYMLAQNVKLEQEAVSYQLFGGRKQRQEMERVLWNFHIFTAIFPLLNVILYKKARNTEGGREKIWERDTAYLGFWARL